MGRGHEQGQWLIHAELGLGSLLRRLQLQIRMAFACEAFNNIDVFTFFMTTIQKHDEKSWKSSGLGNSQGQNAMTCTCEIAGDFDPHAKSPAIGTTTTPKTWNSRKAWPFGHKGLVLSYFFMRKHGFPPLLRAWGCLWFFYIKGRFFFQQNWSCKVEKV